MYDLHLHSAFSDGDLSPAELTTAAAVRGIRGLSLTDHNGIWGAAALREAAAQRGLACVDGIEVSVREADTDIHVLGYSTSFREQALQHGLRRQLAGYDERMNQMVRKCQAAGYARVTAAAVRGLRSGQHEPCYLSYDVGRVLSREYGLKAEQARALVTGKGMCAVSYGEWTLTAAAAVELLHAAGGVAVWAHPGLVLRDGGERVFAAVLDRAAAAGIDGVEVYHPYHSPEDVSQLAQLAAERDWLITGGSDWHGPGRYGQSDQLFGNIGVGEADFQRLLERIARRTT